MKKIFITTIISLTLVLSAQSFTDINAGLTGLYYSSSDWGDFDNDGDLDIVILGQTSSGTNYSRIYRNDGANVFTDIGAGLSGLYEGSVKWGDYNSDGYLDLVITGRSSQYTTSTKIYRNNKNGTFTDINAGMVQLGDSSSDWGDYDNDGDLDLLITGYDSSNLKHTIIYRNDGGVFTKIVTGMQNVSESTAVFGDYDNDGDLDVALCGGNESHVISRIYRNDGSNTFTDINANLINLYNRASFDWGDYNNDGDLDLLYSGRFSPSEVMRIYGNDGRAYRDSIRKLNVGGF
jgi:hypothetical protein